MDDQKKSDQEDQYIVLDESMLLAFERTRLAADRTLMSWIRTAFSMISFGFVIIKFFEILRGLHIKNHFIQMAGSTTIGIFLILLGIFCLIPATIEHHQELKHISSFTKGRKWSYAFIVAILVGVVGVYALADIIAIHVLKSLS